MSRGLSAAAISQITGENIYIGFLWRGDFNSQTIRFWTGLGDLKISGVTYQGNGYLHSVSGFSEDSGKVVSESIAVRLAGVPSSIISLALNEAFESQTGYITVAFLNSNGSVLAHERLFEGTLDTTDINESAKSSEVILTYKDNLARIKTEREKRWTPEEHKIDFPGDAGFDYVPALESRRLYWGRPDTTRARV